MFNCNLPPTALLAEWPRSFMCYCNNTVVDWILEYESARKADLGEENSPAGTGAHILQITVRCCNHWAIHAPDVFLLVWGRTFSLQANLMKYISKCVCVCVSVHVCVHKIEREGEGEFIYIYLERVWERDTEREFIYRYLFSNKMICPWAWKHINYCDTNSWVLSV